MRTRIAVASFYPDSSSEQQQTGFQTRPNWLYRRHWVVTQTRGLTHVAVQVAQLVAVADGAGDPRGRLAHAALQVLPLLRARQAGLNRVTGIHFSRHQILSYLAASGCYLF